MVQQIYQLVSGYGQTGRGWLLDGGLEELNEGDSKRERDGMTWGLVGC